MFFYDTGWTQNVIRRLYGWEESPWPEDPQCAYTSSTRPSFGVGDLRKTDKQLIKTYSWWGDWRERSHMRMWEGGYGSGSEGWWSIGAAHHEQANVVQGIHCLIPHDPYGSSFDLAEYHVWNDALGYYPHWFWNAQNANKPDGTAWNNNCGYTVHHDGIAVSVDIPSNTLTPGEILMPGQHRYSSDLRFQLVYQTDGNLVLYQGGVGAIWNIWINTSPGWARMQYDGNFVTYNSAGQPYWNSATWNSPGAWLIVQNDGNVVIYNTNGVPIWWTGTCCR